MFLFVNYATDDNDTISLECSMYSMGDKIAPCGHPINKELRTKKLAV